MGLWIWVTIGAAISQTVRSAYQKKLKAPIGDLGASYVRFSYAVPFLQPPYMQIAGNDLKK